MMGEFYMRSLNADYYPDDQPARPPYESAKKRLANRIADLCMKHGISIMVRMRCTEKGIEPINDDAVIMGNELYSWKAFTKKTLEGINQIMPDGSERPVVEISISEPLYGPDGIVAEAREE
jgi:hypothetical protein